MFIYTINIAGQEPELNELDLLHPDDEIINSNLHNNELDIKITEAGGNNNEAKTDDDSSSVSFHVAEHSSVSLL